MIWNKNLCIYLVVAAGALIVTVAAYQQARPRKSLQHKSEEQLSPEKTRQEREQQLTEMIRNLLQEPPTQWLDDGECDNRLWGSTIEQILDHYQRTLANITVIEEPPGVAYYIVIQYDMATRYHLDLDPNVIVFSSDGFWDPKQLLGAKVSRISRYKKQ
jgi:hypothetical protein